MYLKIAMLLSISLLTACQSVSAETPIDDINRQINTINYHYPVRHVTKAKDLNVYSVVDLDKMTKCEQERAVLSPASLNMNEEQFNILWNKLVQGIRQDKKYIFDYGECTADGPMITKITECTPEICSE